MPELPEVEVVRCSLAPRLVGRRFESVEVRSPGLREPLDRAALEGLAGRRILALRRRAKYLLIDVEEGRTLVLHLGMSGRLTLAPAGEPPALHEHLAFRLDRLDLPEHLDAWREGGEGWRLRLVDPRRFGLAFVLPTAVLEGDRHFAHLGVEPLSEDFSGAALRRAARGRRGPVKSFLMDARVVVGVGNIYASEALYRAGIHPNRSVARVAAARWCRLAEAVVAVLRQAIAEGGTTLNDFVDGEGRGGYFQVSLSVYGREGEPCPRCATPIRRAVHAGRGTFYCPRCQR